MRFSLSSQFCMLVSLYVCGSLPVLGVEITQGMMLANSCAACHGTDGKSPGAIPSINGKSFEFIVKSMKGFREGTTPSTIMVRHAQGYTNREILLIAEHFSKLP